MGHPPQLLNMKEAYNKKTQRGKVSVDVITPVGLHLSVYQKTLVRSALMLTGYGTGTYTCQTKSPT